MRNGTIPPTELKITPQALNGVKNFIITMNELTKELPTLTPCNFIDKLIKKIQSTPGARIDILGMQSHISMNHPTASLYEVALKQFLDLGVDVQVTELDIGNGNSISTPKLLADKYAQFFELFLKYRKTEGKNGISGVTLWGILDERSWISNNGAQAPLLFHEDFRCKPAFYSVLETAKNWND